MSREAKTFDEWIASDEGVKRFGMELRDEWIAAAREEWNRRAEGDLAAETLKWKITDEALRSSCDEVAALKRENADLLAALKDILDNDGSDGHYDATLLSIARKEARAAIARHEHE